MTDAMTGRDEPADSMAKPPVVMFATADWFWPYWTNKQHIAARLAKRGHDVLYVESIGMRRPGFNGTDIARMARRLLRAAAIREVRDRVWVLSPLTLPGAAHQPAIARANAFQLRTRIAGWLRPRAASRPIVWTYHPFMLDVAKALAPATLVYHAVDDLAAVPGIEPQHFLAAEHRLMQAADVIFTTSPALHERAEKIAPGRSDHFGNLVDVAHFAAARAPGALPPDLAAVPVPRLGYVGALSDFKIDFALLDAVMRQRPDWHLVLIGEEREGQKSPSLAALASRPNVHHLGWKPYAALPDHLRGIDVALLPQQRNAYTDAMFPMKFFEYLAAGRPVVATPLPALAEHADLHRIATGPERFIDAIGEALDDPRPLPADHPALAAHAWDTRLDKMLARIAKAIAAQGDHP